MKVLLLIILSDSGVYNEMFEIQKQYVHSHPNVDAYFVTCRSEQEEVVVVDKDIIYVKGVESYINILYKTIKALDYVIHTLSGIYYYVIRSNISTMIHLSNLFAYVKHLPKDKVYTGCTLETLRWQLAPYEICESKQSQRNDFYGIQYIQGTSIILSKDVVQQLLDIQSTIEYDIVYDVKLGLVIREHLPDVYSRINHTPLAKVVYNAYEEGSIFIRNRSTERLLDVHRMRMIVNQTYSIESHSYPKTIFITRKDHDDKLARSSEQWSALNPEYQVEAYDDNQCLQFLHRYYGVKYGDIFQHIKDGPIKADFFRACILYIYGGVYVDADIKPISPFREYVDETVDLMTCISYNYCEKSTFGYNPQLIVAKRYSKELYDIIKTYESMYDSKIEYDYWRWSICTLFLKIHNFSIQPDGHNLFVHNGKKYQFIVEEIIDTQNNEIYNFTNFEEHKEMLFTPLDI